MHTTSLISSCALISLAITGHGNLNPHVYLITWPKLISLQPCCYQWGAQTFSVIQKQVSKLWHQRKYRLDKNSNKSMIQHSHNLFLKINQDNILKQEDVGTAFLHTVSQWAVGFSLTWSLVGGMLQVRKVKQRKLGQSGTNISITIGWIAMEFGTDVHGPQRMHHILTSHDLKSLGDQIWTC